MKKFILLAVFIFLFASPVLAEDDTSIRTTTESDSDTRLDLDAGSPDDSSAKGNVEMEYKVEQGESASEPDDTAVTEGNAEISQYNETDLDFVRARGSSISADAVEVRGWDEQRKADFLREVKKHAEIQSGQDLENFARGVLLRDENVDEVELGEDDVRMDYRLPAKFLGIFPALIRARTTVVTNQTDETNSDKFGRVKTKFAWYHVFFRKFVSEDELEQEINDEVLVVFENNGSQAEADDRPVETLSLNYGKIQAEVLDILGSVMQRAHETAKNSINNLK